MEALLTAWALVYFLEGISGFGVPVAVAAPVLVSFGHSPSQSISCCLIMNALAAACVPFLIHLCVLNAEVGSPRCPKRTLRQLLPATWLAQNQLPSRPNDPPQRPLHSMIVS